MRFEIVKGKQEESESEELIKLGLVFDGEGVAVYSINSEGKRKYEVWFNLDKTIEIMVPTGEEKRQKLISSNFKELILS